MVLYILMKGPSLDWIEDTHLYDHIRAWRKRIEMLMTSMAEERAPRFHLSLQKGLVRGDRPCTH